LDNLGGTSAGRLSGGQITGTAVGNVGGTDTKTLVTGNLPPYTPSGSVSTSTTINNGTNIMQGGASSQGGGLVNGSTVLVNITASSSSSFSGNAQGGTSVPFGILQPSIMVTQILVVE
jgi:hypothetical protein